MLMEEKKKNNTHKKQILKMQRKGVRKKMKAGNIKKER